MYIHIFVNGFQLLFLAVACFCVPPSFEPRSGNQRSEPRSRGRLRRRREGETSGGGNASGGKGTTGKP